MSSPEFGWESLLYTDAPSGCSLKAALLTTYDRPDERLLVEHLLPLLLKLTREPDGEGAERQFFLLELDRRLKQLHDKLVVVSSTTRDEEADADAGESCSYEWIWRSIRHLTVGRRGRAVQHAKLWLLHWGAADGEGAEYLEIVVSSSNLTMSAFKGQLQSAWRACVELRPQRAETRLDAWGVLPDFLRELASSAGEDGRNDQFVDLLARAACPDGVSFLASVPGTHSRQVLRRTPWGAAGLRAVMPPGRGPVSVSILSPYIGAWKCDALRRWCAHFDGSSGRIELVWIDKHHPWARARRWLLPKITLVALVEGGATLLHLRHEADDPDSTDVFHEEHRAADDRWSHAKVYVLRRGVSHRALVTSANFSAAAWGSESGDGDLTIENFELGVCVAKGVWPFESLAVFLDAKDAATVSELPARSSNQIAWARATWDGIRVVVECRCEAKSQLAGDLQAGGTWTEITEWSVSADGRLRSATVPWAESRLLPSVVRLACEQETVIVAIFDLRPPRAREDSVPPEVDEDVAQAMRDQLLFEQYGSTVAPEDGDDPEHESLERNGDDADTDLTVSSASVDGAGAAKNDDDEREGAGGRPDSYAVPAFVHARRHLRVVDNWADLVARQSMTGIAAFERQWLLRDGELLADAFRRQATRDEKVGADRALGARLAAEEMTLRLKHFPEA